MPDPDVIFSVPCVASRHPSLRLGRVKQVLRQQVAAVLDDAPRATAWCRVQVPIRPVDPFAWLDATACFPRMVWSGRSDDAVVAAAGAADEVTLAPGPLAETLAPLRARARLLTPDDEVRYYGGLWFDTRQAPGSAWTAFGTGHFVVPRFELCSEDGAATLTCNVRPAADAAHRDDLLASIDALPVDPTPLDSSLPMPRRRIDCPQEEGWMTNVNWALDAFARGVLRKVVLAREVRFSFAEPLAPTVLLQTLQAATTDCFHFLMQPEASAAFVGASPERLFRMEEGHVWSEAVAGTRPRGASRRADQRLRDELLDSDKDQREHTLVRQAIVETLRAHCETLSVDAEASEMRLARGRHLVTAIEGRARTDVTPLDLLAALHPTPAVNGTPARAAQQAIATREPFDRGWYAGPVGWIGAQAAEFAVAIRSGRVAPDHLALYSGAGIVPGSEAEQEWAEIEQKIGDFLSVLGVHPT